jgi:hypothetical protein
LAVAQKEKAEKGTALVLIPFLLQKFSYVIDRVFGRRQVLVIFRQGASRLLMESYPASS